MKKILKSYQKVFFISILVTAVLAIAGLLIFNNKMIAMGFVIGNVCRCAGVLSIINSSYILMDSNKPRMRAMGFYMLRYSFYGVAIAVSLKRGVNAISLLIGFAIFDVIVYLYHKKNVPEK